MTALPEKSRLTGTPTTGEYKLALSELHDYLTQLLGETGEAEDAREALGVGAAIAAAVAALNLPNPATPSTYLRRSDDNTEYEAWTPEQVAEELDELLPLAALNLGKAVADPAEAVSGSLLSGAMLAAGAIVEQGSNANGHYVRWEGGLQICWRQTTGYLATTSGNGQSFPADFVGVYTGGWTTSSGLGGGANREAVAASVLEVQSGRWLLRSVRSTDEWSSPLDITFFAIGNWK